MASQPPPSRIDEHHERQARRSRVVVLVCFLRQASWRPLLLSISRHTATQSPARTYIHPPLPPVPPAAPTAAAAAATAPRATARAAPLLFQSRCPRRSILLLLCLEIVWWTHNQSIHPSIHRSMSPCSPCIHPSTRSFPKPSIHQPIPLPFPHPIPAHHTIPHTSPKPDPATRTSSSSSTADDDDDEKPP